MKKRLKIIVLSFFFFIITKKEVLINEINQLVAEHQNPEKNTKNLFGTEEDIYPEDLENNELEGSQNITKELKYLEFLEKQVIYLIEKILIY